VSIHQVNRHPDFSVFRTSYQVIGIGKRFLFPFIQLQCGKIESKKTRSIDIVSFRKPKIFYGYIVVAAAFLILIAMIGAVMTFGVFINPISNEFDWGYAIITGAQSVSILISGFLGILSGRLSDKLGPKKVVLISNLFFGAGLVLMSQVNTIWQLYLFYGGILAIGMSSAIAPLQSTVVRWFVKKRGLIVSIFLMGLTAGSMIMPPIANQLILVWGWRTAFSILGTTLFSIVLIAAMFLKNNPAEIGELPYGMDESGDTGSITEQTSGIPFREAFGTVQFWLLCAFFFLIAFAMMTIMTHIVPHAINLGISSTVAAVIMATIGGVSTAAMIPNGFMADKISVHKAAIILTIILVISMIWLSVFGNGTLQLFLFAIVFGIAFSSLDILLTLLSSSLFGLIALGTIIGFVNAILQVGGAIGPLLAGIIFDSNGSYQLAFVLCAVMSAVAVFIAIFLKPPRFS